MQLSNYFPSLSPTFSQAKQKKNHKNPKTNPTKHQAPAFPFSILEQPSDRRRGNAKGTSRRASARKMETDGVVYGGFRVFRSGFGIRVRVGRAKLRSEKRTSEQTKQA